MQMRTPLSLLLIGLVVGCSRQDTEIREQNVPKLMQAAMPMVAPQVAGASELQWTMPKEWKQLPGQQMRLASFQVSDKNPEVQFTIVPLGMESGGLLANVNRWEGQIGRQPSKEADLSKVVTHVKSDGFDMDLVDLTGPATAKPQLRMLGAILPHGEKTYYFKLAGPADVVGPQKDNFLAFMNSVRFGGAPMAAPDAAAAPGNVPPLPAGHPQIPGAEPQGAMPNLPAGHPQIPGAAPAAGAPAAEAPMNDFTYTTPAGWAKDGAMPMRLVSFHIGEDQQRVDVVVTRLPATGTGSYIDNINRWRGQVGLPASKDGDPQVSQPIKVSGVDGTLFDFTGPGAPQQAKRILVAWIPSQNDWWFFRVTGPASLVTQQQAAFDGFLKSVKFAGAAQ